ncbi:MAG: hypothetical protein ACPGJV_08025 [Bacteriovoracaceae bacterium]
MNIIKLFLSAILLSSCGILDFYKTKPTYKPSSQYSPEDYVRQISFLGQSYLKQNKSLILPISKQSQEYFRSIYTRVTARAEKYLKYPIPRKDIKVVILKMKSPLYFCLPDGTFVFSSRLFEKYLDNEDLFVAVFSTLIYMAHNHIYRKQIFYPKGSITTRELLQMVYLSPEVRFEVNKWGYFIMSRAGFDSSAFLSFIQIKNKNVLEFSMMYKDLNVISREEYNFKNFIVEMRNIETNRNPRNSSKKFYVVKKELEKHARIKSI